MKYRSWDLVDESNLKASKLMCVGGLFAPKNSLKNDKTSYLNQGNYSEICGNFNQDMLFESNLFVKFLLFEIICGNPHGTPHGTTPSFHK